MPREAIVWILILGVIGIGLAICTVLFEKLLHQRKQKKYDALHRSMGLHPTHHDSAHNRLSGKYR